MNCIRFFSIILSVFCFSYVKAQTENTPPVNRSIIGYVNSVIGKKVDRGECWDLANKALGAANAVWDHDYKYGKLVNPDSDTIYPGDIIQFYNVKLKYVKDGKIWHETMSHHTAIVYSVKEKSVYEIAQQNTTGRAGKKVSIDPLDLKSITNGKIKVYRPVAGK